MERLHGKMAYAGSLVADAFSMPVHWYYNTNALDEDYPELANSNRYLSPKNPHPDSILWRSTYEPLTPDADILHDQAHYWGQRGIHYHQFLLAGQNTVNFQLARELYQYVTESGTYDPETWLQRYVQRMREPDWHGDTYVEEYHRAFFNRRAQGTALMKCGIDDKHIGGLSQVPALYTALCKIGVFDHQELREIIKTHIGLTHKNRRVLESGDVLVKLFLALAEGCSLGEALMKEANGVVSMRAFRDWESKPDRVVIGRMLSSACYIEDSFPASLYLAWKYRERFTAGIRANALVGGDNCHRGAVVGSLLAMTGDISTGWLDTLEAAI